MKRPRKSLARLRGHVLEQVCFFVLSQLNNETFMHPANSRVGDRGKKINAVSCEKPPKTLVPLAEAAKVLPVRVTSHTLRRWGLEGLDGHKLALTRVGRRLYADPADVREFAIRAVAVQG